MHYTKTRLASGLRIITVPMRDTKSFTLLVLFGTGSKYETPRTMGVSHFLEHLFFKGTERRPIPGQVHEELDNIGADHNAFTSKEYTGYWVKASSRMFPRALDIVTDILLNPLFKEEEIERERGVILQEMNMYRDNPMRQIGELFETLLYGNQPAGWDTIGTRETVLGLTRKNVVAYRDSQYVASNAVVIAAGNIKEEEAIRAMKQAFAGLNKGHPRSMPHVRGTQKTPMVMVEHKKTDQTHLVFGARGYTMHDKERYAASLLATMLGGKTSSRLFREIREKHGLAYALSADSDTYTDTGYFSVYMGVPHDKLKEAIERTVSICKDVRDNGIPESELQYAKDFYRGHLAIGLESSDEVATFYGTQELFYKTLKDPDDVMRLIERVTVKDIHAVAKHIFETRYLNLAVIGPHGDAAAFRDLLRM